MTRVLVAASVALSACALKGDVRRVEREVQELREQTARADSARAVELVRILAQLASIQSVVLDSLSSHQRRFASFQGGVVGDLTEVQRQLVLIQELTGQSQQRLSEFRRQLERRAQSRTPPATPVPADSLWPDDSQMIEGPGPEELYDVSLQQLRRGSPQTARLGFQTLLREFPSYDRVPDARFFVGETWGISNPDSAAAAYEQVVREHPESPRAPTSLYRLGLLAEQLGDGAAARIYYQRVLAGYPRSDEAPLARSKLQALGR